MFAHTHGHSNTHTHTHTCARTRAGLLTGLSSGDWLELLAILETLLFVGCQQGKSCDKSNSSGEAYNIAFSQMQRLSADVRIGYLCDIYLTRTM